MGKKKNTALEDQMRWDLLPLLHKECVRRNAEYAKELKEAKKQSDHETQQVWFMDIQERWALWLCPPLPNPDKRPKIRLPKENSETKLLGRIEEDSDPIENFVEDYLIGRICTNSQELQKRLKGFAVILYFPEEENTPIFRAALDLRRPKKEFKNFLSQLVEEMFERRKRHNLQQVNPPGRHHFETELDYLRVWDLKKKKNKHAEIAKIIWPDRDNPKSYITKYLKKAEELINNPPLFQYFNSYLAKRGENREIPVHDYNPPMIVPKRKARFREGGDILKQLVNQRRMRFGPSLIRSRMPEDEIIIES